MGFQARSSARSSEFFSYVVKIAFLCIHFIEHGSKAGFFEGKKDLLSFYPESQEHRTVQENGDTPEIETWRNFVVLRARPFHVIVDLLFGGILQDYGGAKPVYAPGL